MLVSVRVSVRRCGCEWAPGSHADAQPGGRTESVGEGGGRGFDRRQIRGANERQLPNKADQVGS